jgi:hypothetical protein
MTGSTSVNLATVAVDVEWDTSLRGDHFISLVYHLSPSLVVLMQDSNFVGCSAE